MNEMNKIQSEAEQKDLLIQGIMKYLPDADVKHLRRAHIAIRNILGKGEYKAG